MSPSVACVSDVLSVLVKQDVDNSDDSEKHGPRVKLILSDACELPKTQSRISLNVDVKLLALDPMVESCAERISCQPPQIELIKFLIKSKRTSYRCFANPITKKLCEIFCRPLSAITRWLIHRFEHERSADFDSRPE